MNSLAFDIGSNSVGSAWINKDSREITTGTSIFPAGVEESDEKRGDPINAKRRMTRRTRITLARRARRKRELRLRLIGTGMLPRKTDEFKQLLDRTDPWELRRKGLDKPLSPIEFGRVLLHLAQRRGALGLKIADPDDSNDENADEDGKVKAAIGEVRRNMKECSPPARTFGEFIAMLRAERVTPITSEDRRPPDQRKGPREYRSAIRNKGGNYEHCTDREMIRHEFDELWKKQKEFGGDTASLLTDELREMFDDDAGDSIWRHKGLLFGQRRQSWDLGTLGRCVLEPTERCAPHADRYASRYLVVETVNNLKIIERGKLERPLTSDERKKIKDYLSGPLGMEKGRKKKGAPNPPADRPKTTVSVADLRNLMGWGRASKTSQYRFNIENDEERQINTDWFSREIVHGAVTSAKWAAMAETVREGLNRAILKFNPDEDGDADKLKKGVLSWAGLSEVQADALVVAWQRRPKPDSKRLNMSRRAVRIILTIMDRPEPWPDDKNPGQTRWLDQNTARRLIAGDEDARNLAVEAIAKTTVPESFEKQRTPKNKPNLPDAPAKSLGVSLASQHLSRKSFVKAMRDRGMEPDGHIDSDYLRVLRAWEQERRRQEKEANRSNFEPKPEPAFSDKKLRRYTTGAKGATARDRHYLRKHVLTKNGEDIIGPDGKPLAEPPPAPLISNPVVRKAIHEVRRHLVEYMTTFGRKPENVYIELAREARMGKMDADRLLFRNRLRNRIRLDILEAYHLHSVSATQQRAAVDRVVLCMQQGGATAVCPLCGKHDGLTPLNAAKGNGCEVAHIIPKAGGGHNGLGNLVLAHTKCNRDMDRRTPRQFWDATLKGGFDEAIVWVEKIYTDVDRPKPSEVKNSHGDALWSCYFAGRPGKFGPTFDERKIEQFKKDIKDIKEMTERQAAATMYATRQVMAYLADALYDGNGLPERGGKQYIFATDGMWTSRFRREWGLFFDPHGKKAKGLTNNQEHERQEKDRGDHRHHAIDAIVIAYCDRKMQLQWEEREKQADKEGVNTADEQQMENYRRLHPIPPPNPFKTREEFREAVRRAVYGDQELERPISHRPVKRKLIGEFHEAFPRGPVLDHSGKLTDRFTKKISILSLSDNHLRMPGTETNEEAIERLAARRQRKKNVDEKTARKWARQVVSIAKPVARQSSKKLPEELSDDHKAIVSRIVAEHLAGGLSKAKAGKAIRAAGIRDYKSFGPFFSQAWTAGGGTENSAYLPAIADPPPTKSGIVRDPALRQRLRECLSEGGVNPDDFSTSQLKKLVEAGGLRHASGVPIQSVVLLWTISDPVVVSHWHTDHATGERRRLYDATTGEGDARAARAYIGGNNHHIEIRVSTDEKCREGWKGETVSAYDAAQRKLARLRAFKKAGVPKNKDFRRLPKSERERLAPVMRSIEQTHPLVDRRDRNDKGGRFVMSLCEGEMLLMRRKPEEKGGPPGPVSYYVVAKLDKPNGIVLVPHWDARAAGERKDSEGKKVPDSKREQFTITPTDLKELAPPGESHAIKVRVTPLGQIMRLERD